jgi:hypothetical protein
MLNFSSLGYHLSGLGTGCRKAVIGEPRHCPCAVESLTSDFLIRAGKRGDFPEIAMAPISVAPIAIPSGSGSPNLEAVRMLEDEAEAGRVFVFVAAGDPDSERRENIPPGSEGHKHSLILVQIITK